MRGRTGGFRVKAVHPLEGVLMEFYELDGASVHRLALFVLACTVVDQMVTILVTSSRLQSFPQILSGKGPLRLAKKIRKAKFAHRLKDARRFLSDTSYQAAKDLNSARNTFLHDHEVPSYRGQKVTSLSGLRKCFAAVLAVFREVVADVARRQAASNRRSP